MIRPGLEAVREQLAQDGDDVGPVQSDCRDVEDGRDSGIRPQPNESDRERRERQEPDAIDRRVRARANLVPNAAERDELVAGQRPEGARARLHASHTCEI